MHIDVTRARALRLPTVMTTVERGRLRFFAQATGQTDPVYTDVEAARAAGYPDLPVPPTFFFSLELEGPGPAQYLRELGVDFRHILHGEQAYTYHAMAFAGQTLTLQPRIVDVTRKKGGALELLQQDTTITNEADELVAEASFLLAIQHPTAVTA